MKLKIVLASLLVAIGPHISHAISIGSISDAISNNTSSPTAPTTPVTQTAQNLHKANVTTTHTASPTENHLPNPALFIEDAAMTGYIHSQLLLKRNIPNVHVSTDNAVVSLSGTVDTQEQADTIVKTAYSVKGVKFVNTDHLIVREKA